MRRSTAKIQVAVLLVLLMACSLPVGALCWGSLYVMSRTTQMRNRCPTPTLTKTWRIRCYDGCGYTEGTFVRELVGYGECFQSDNCTEGVRCLPAAGVEVHGFNPPSLSAAMIHREGYDFAGCTAQFCRTAGISTMMVVCPCDPDGGAAFCAVNDPIVVSLADSRYELTDRDGGVHFDLGDTGSTEQVPWTEIDSDEAFLMLDRNGNGRVDSGRELFGDATPQHPSDQPNGFRALAVYDDVLSGGNEDGRLSALDAIYPQLRLWWDRDHDGLSDAGELVTLEAAGLTWIDLAYEESGRVDRHGNAFRFRAQAGWEQGGARLIWNVFLNAP